MSPLLLHWLVFPFSGRYHDQTKNPACQWAALAKRDSVSNVGWVSKHSSVTEKKKTHMDSIYLSKAHRARTGIFQDMLPTYYITILLKQLQSSQRTSRA